MYVATSTECQVSGKVLGHLIFSDLERSAYKPRETESGGVDDLQCQTRDLDTYNLTSPRNEIRHAHPVRVQGQSAGQTM